MGILTQHTDATAPAGAASVLARVKQRYGFIPNLAAFLAESPRALDAVLTLSASFDESSLTPQEQQLVLLAASASNQCAYCTTVHSALARKAGLPTAQIRAASGGAPIQERKLEALREVTTALVANRGRVDDALLRRFLDVGYSKAQLLEVVMGIALKTFTNYCNHLAGAQPNPEFVVMARDE